LEMSRIGADWTGKRRPDIPPGLWYWNATSD
jgi:hypothetical protein